jgi:sporulation protein YlmC with PRC-barrel domain
MLKMKRISDMYGMKVFTDSGEYFGDVEEAVLTSSKVYGWRVRAGRESFLGKILGGGAKGVIVPHNFVESVGDVMIIRKLAIPSSASDEMPAAEEGDEN